MYTNRVFGMGKFVLFNKLSSLQGVLIRGVTAVAIQITSIRQWCAVNSISVAAACIYSIYTGNTVRLH